MIYTIGHKRNYLKAIDDSPDGKIIKIGKRQPCIDYPQGYEGGYAFRSIEDAKKRIDEAYSRSGFDVFGLMTTWENTEPSKDGWWNNLIDDAGIVSLNN